VHLTPDAVADLRRLRRSGRVFVLAIGSRSDAAVYASAAKRLAALRSDHPAQDLSSILDAIAGPEPDSPPR
jgi:hypothetical protein